jgi:hypothetical protein
VLLAGFASAHPMHGQRARASATGLAPTLQQILDGLVVSGPPIDAGAPIDTELWQNTSPSMTAQVVADNVPEQDIRFGLYDPDQVDKPAFVLSDMMSPTEVATVTFLDNGSITVNGGIKQSPQSGFEGPFGFFMSTGTMLDSTFFYTQDGLNPGGSARAVVFEGNGETMLKLPGLQAGLFLPGQFLIAWETGLGDANDGKFNDFLVLVSNIVPGTVPEPSFALLLGISSLALICGRRARRRLN